jgi:precorrin-6A/cobalt-precorrin-6A reductase
MERGSEWNCARCLDLAREGRVMIANPRRRVLLLGGTTEASQLAREMSERLPLIHLTVSFAGRTNDRAALPTNVVARVGGFGGVTGLGDYLTGEGVDAVVDATHPFAARMPFNVSAACEATGTPLLRLVRPAWVEMANDRWTHVADMAHAAAAVARSGAGRVLLTIGRQELATFTRCPAATFVVRAIEPSDALPDAEVILARGPFTLTDERELLQSRRIELMVSKNSGGDATRAKIDAARELSIPVVMVGRPPNPPGASVSVVSNAIGWITEVLERQVAQ